MTSTLNRIIKNTGYLYIKTLVSMFVMLFVTRVVLRSLGAEDFGIFDVVGGSISMLGFVNASMASTLQRFLNNAQGKNDKLLQYRVFNIGVLFHVAIAIVIVFILFVWYFFLFNGALNISPNRLGAAKIVFFCLVVSTFFEIITVPYDASINAHEDMLTYSIIGIIGIFIKLFVAIAIIYTTKDKLILYAVLMIIVPTATYLMMKFWCSIRYEECHLSIREYYDKTLARQMLSFSGWSMLGSSSNLIGNYGNSIVLNHFFGSVLSAVMGIANQFQGMLIVLSSGMLRSLNPIIYKSGASDSKLLAHYSLVGCKYSYLLLAIFAFPVMVETPFVLQIWLGEVPQWTVLFVRLQLFRCLLEQLTTTLNRSLESFGRIRVYNSWTFILNVMPIFVLYMLYSIGFKPYWHYIIAIVFMVVLMGIMKLFFCNKYLGLSIKEYCKEVLRPCFLYTIGPVFVTIVMKSIINWGNAWFSFSMMCMISLSVIVSGFVVLNKEERQTVLNCIRRIDKS